MEQRTPEWFSIRLGKVTSSRIADVCAKTKSGYSASRANYMAELLCERLTGNPTESFKSPAMQRGIDMEPNAIDRYEGLTGNLITKIGFVPHAGILMAGCSPDGLIDDDGLIELKCPNTATHIETLLGGSIAGNYMLQIQWQMACTSRLWCDFVSYDDRLPDHMAMHVRRVERDEKIIEELEAETIKFLAELDEKIAKLQSKVKG